MCGGLNSSYEQAILSLTAFFLETTVFGEYEKNLEKDEENLEKYQILVLNYIILFKQYDNYNWLLLK